MRDALESVRAYARRADAAVVEKMAATYRLVLSNRDAAMVSFSHAELDKAIKAVGEKMKDGRSNPRLALYDLLAEHFDKLDVLKA